MVKIFGTTKDGNVVTTIGRETKGADGKMMQKIISQNTDKGPKYDGSSLAMLQDGSTPYLKTDSERWKYNSDLARATMELVGVENFKLTESSKGTDLSVGGSVISLGKLGISASAWKKFSETEREQIATKAIMAEYMSISNKSRNQEEQNEHLLTSFSKFTGGVSRDTGHQTYLRTER